MNSRPPLRTRLSAFTLIELLTVIAIIAILMGLLFPALSIVKDQANKVKARTDLINTVAAVKQYYTEYGKYPLTGSGAAANTDVAFGDSVSGASSPISNEALYNILRNYPATTASNRPSPDGNPRQIVFFEGRNGIATGGNPRGGFASSSTGGTVGAFYDPWGNQYCIEIDGNYDNFLTVPYLDFTSGNPNGLNYSCLGWSVGKDGQLGTKGDKSFKNTATGSTSDDIITWQ